MPEPSRHQFHELADPGQSANLDEIAMVHRSAPALHGIGYQLVLIARVV